MKEINRLPLMLAQVCILP